MNGYYEVYLKYRSYGEIYKTKDCYSLTSFYSKLKNIKPDVNYPFK